MNLSLNNSLIDSVAGRAETFAWDAKIVGADGRTQEAMDLADHVRFKLSATQGGTPILELHSNQPATGSRVTITDHGSATSLAKGTVVMSRPDTAALSGEYFWELIHIDVSEPVNLQDKIICRGKIKFADEQQGSTGVP